FSHSILPNSFFPPLLFFFQSFFSIVVFISFVFSSSFRSPSCAMVLLQCWCGGGALCVRLLCTFLLWSTREVGHDRHFILILMYWNMLCVGCLTAACAFGLEQMLISVYGY
ncbi:hypothetical protein VIGAN_02248700, partial [Vigna angularis var. angularis]